MNNHPLRDQKAEEAPQSGQVGQNGVRLPPLSPLFIQKTIHVGGAHQDQVALLVGRQPPKESNQGVASVFQGIASLPLLF
jgi:hypothetical protein